MGAPPKFHESALSHQVCDTNEKIPELARSIDLESIFREGKFNN